MPTVINAETINAICYFTVAFIIGIPFVIAVIYKVLG